jgi:hypothetical protein
LILRGTGEKRLAKEQADADDDAGISHVKGGPVKGSLPMEVEKVDHVSQLQTIDQITKGTSEDEA